MNAALGTRCEDLIEGIPVKWDAPFDVVNPYLTAIVGAAYESVWLVDLDQDTLFLVVRKFRLSGDCPPRCVVSLPTLLFKSRSARAVEVSVVVISTGASSEFVSREPDSLWVQVGRAHGEVLVRQDDAIIAAGLPDAPLPNGLGELRREPLGQSREASASTSPDDT